MQVGKDQAPVGIPSCLIRVDWSPGICFGLNSWGKRQRGGSWPLRGLFSKGISALIAADANMGADFCNASRAPAGAGRSGYGAQEGNMRMLADSGGLKTGFADQENGGEAVRKDIEVDGRAKGGLHASVDEGPPDC